MTREKKLKKIVEGAYKEYYKECDPEEYQYMKTPFMYVARLVADEYEQKNKYLREQLNEAKELLQIFIEITDFGTDEDFELRCKAEELVRKEL